MEAEEELRSPARVRREGLCQCQPGGLAREGPARKGAAAEEGFGGPLAEVDGESDAVAVVAGEERYVLAARMEAEDGAHFFGEENGAAPTVGDAHVSEGWVQMADAVFEPAQTRGGLALANIVEVQIARGVFD